MAAANNNDIISNEVRSAFFADLAVSVDPIRFFTRLIGKKPDPWQAELLLSTDRRIILNCARQTGKSTVTAILALHHALNNPGALVLLLSPSQRQSSELYKKVANNYRDLGKPVPSEIENLLSLELVNGSRVLSLPGGKMGGDTLRGFTPSLIVIDEASRVSDEVFYGALSPMLSVSGGRLLLLSTPCGRRGFFWRLWNEQSNWKKVRITANECPRISAETLEEKRMELGDWWFRQEFMCEFSENVDAYFSYSEIHEAITNEVKPLFGPDGKLRRERSEDKS